FSNLGNLGASFDSLWKGFDVKVFDSIAGAIGGGWKKLDALFSSTWGKIDFGQWEKVTNFAEDFGGNFAAAWNDFGGKLSDAWKDFGGKISDAWKDLGANFSQGWKDFAS